MSGASIATQCWVYYYNVVLDVGMSSVSFNLENRKTKKLRGLLFQRQIVEKPTVCRYSYGVISV
jgi:hypothetical protein